MQRLTHVLLLLVSLHFCLGIAESYAGGKNWQTSLTGLIGERRDQIDWNIAGTPQGDNPNVFSELKWDDLKIRQVQLLGALSLKHRLRYWPATSIQAAYSYGEIRSGTNYDTDYSGNDRTGTTAFIINDAGDGNVRDLSISFGPVFSPGREQWSVSPKMGYSRHEQNLTLYNGRQILPVRRLLPELDSSYDTEWQGPWAGGTIEYVSGTGWSIRADLEYHIADYRAEANWNMREDFDHPVSFTHQADGEGLVVALQYSYQFSDHWTLGLLGRYQDWETDAGTDLLYLANGQVLPTRLNEVNWESGELNLSLSYRF